MRKAFLILLAAILLLSGACAPEAEQTEMPEVPKVPVELAVEEPPALTETEASTYHTQYNGSVAVQVGDQVYYTGKRTS